MKKLVLGMVQAIDGFILRIIDVGWASSYDYSLPKTRERKELEEFFITNYFSSQPGRTRIFIYNVYVNTRHACKVILRKLFGLGLKLIKPTPR